MPKLTSGLKLREINIMAFTYIYVIYPKRLR